jgi:hypothetical protein
LLVLRLTCFQIGVDIFVIYLLQHSDCAMPPLRDTDNGSGTISPGSLPGLMARLALSP